MRWLAFGVALLFAGDAVGAPAPPDPEPTSLGEVARRARQKREKAEAERKTAPVPAFSDADLATTKEANRSNMSLPAGIEGNRSISDSGGSMTSSVATEETAPPSEARIEKERLTGILEQVKAQLPAAEAALATARALTNPFSTTFVQDPYAQIAAGQQTAAAQAEVDRIKQEIASIQQTVKDLEKQVTLESMGATSQPPVRPDRPQ